MAAVVVVVFCVSCFHISGRTKGAATVRWKVRSAAVDFLVPSPRLFVSILSHSSERCVELFLSRMRVRRTCKEHTGVFIIGGLRGALFYGVLLVLLSLVA